MNFLAHLYLSGSNAEVRLGNFIGDYVKGNRVKLYPPRVQIGIMLHRTIDQLTDQHKGWKTCRDILRPSYDRWAGVAADVMLDYVLANEWEHYSMRELKGFARTFYFQMLQRYHILPARVRGFLPFMIHSNRLYSYRFDEGIIRTLEIMGNQTKVQGDPHQALWLVKTNYFHFNNALYELISDLKNEIDKTYKF